jgi:NADH:ubiquinone oxidoreductase subunit 6 (subunit J)
MSLIQALFYLLGFIALGSAVFVAASKNLVRSIFMFFITLLSLAGIYVLALADFVAITQIIVYVGGILVLILFAFMLSGRETLNKLQEQGASFLSANKIVSFMLAALFFVVLVEMIVKINPDNLVWINQAKANNMIIQPAANMTDNIGINLMTRYLLPFEVISVLLMMALVGAAHLSRKERVQ